ncbi:SRPBCC family protein [Streptomyces sp. NPDC005573]|uniref:SRPBCC family protein n=1 Tax=unclassified Streptomyces TaxID=2593676 RepID=UPI0033BE1891
MASVVKETVIEARPEDVWAVIGDFAGGPPRIAPGYVVGTRLVADDVRVVTFADGLVARERLIALDHAARRIVWAVIGDTVRPVHDNASFQVVAEGDTRTRLVWIHDVLPDELAQPFARAMCGGLAVIRETLSAPG